MIIILSLYSVPRTLLSNARARARTHTHAHTHIHSLPHTHTHARARTHKHTTHTSASQHTHTRTHARTHARTHTHAYMHVTFLLRAVCLSLTMDVIVTFLITCTAVGFRNSRQLERTKGFKVLNDINKTWMTRTAVWRRQTFSGWKQ